MTTKSPIQDWIKKSISTFLEERGGKDGMTEATLQAILISLPFIGPGLEKVLFGAKDDENKKKTQIILDQCITNIQDATSHQEKINYILQSIKEICSHNQAEISDLSMFFDNTFVQLDDLKKDTTKILSQQALQSSKILELFERLDEQFISEDEVRGHLQRILSAYEAQKIAWNIKSNWPPNPTFSVDKENSTAIFKAISDLEILINKANAWLFKFLGSEQKKFVEYVTNQIGFGLKNYKQQQEHWLNGQFVELIEDMKGTPMHESHFEMTYIWCGFVFEEADNIFETTSKRFLDLSNESKDKRI